MTDKKKQEIIDFCKENNINLINIRNMFKSGRTTIVLTFLCNDCGTRYDMDWSNVKSQTFKGCCTKCAHKRSQDYRRLQAQNLVEKFEQYGYKVITPLDKIKPRGKNDTLNKAIVTIEDRFGYQFEICYNNFHNRLKHYIALNENGDDCYDFEGRVYEQKVKEYLDTKNIPYKREFIVPIKSKKNGTLRFDFCLFYTEPSKRMAIEVDEGHHTAKKVQKRDRQKDYYCKTNNIPLLRINYRIIRDTNDYKDMIDRFIEENSVN